MNSNVKKVCDLQPISYKPEVVNGENTWSRTFEYKNTQNQVGLQITQNVTLHAKNGNESQYQNTLQRMKKILLKNTTAAESQIRDTDMAKEMVFYTNQNILRQAGDSMLVQANQMNNGVLSLLQ